MDCTNSKTYCQRQKWSRWSTSALTDSRDHHACVSTLKQN